MDNALETLLKQIVRVLKSYLERSSTLKEELTNEIVRIKRGYYLQNNQPPEDGVDYADEGAYIYEFSQFGVAIFLEYHGLH